MCVWCELKFILNSRPTPLCSHVSFTEHKQRRWLQPIGHKRVPDLAITTSQPSLFFFFFLLFFFFFFLAGDLASSAAMSSAATSSSQVLRPRNPEAPVTRTRRPAQCEAEAHSTPVDYNGAGRNHDQYPTYIDCL